MFLTEPAHTPYDWNFRLFGTSVRVHPLFWLVSVLLGQSLFKLGIGYVVAWVVCVFVSILLHEMGHILMGQVLGEGGHIVLYSFGGLAIGSNSARKRWQQIAISFAGPGIQLVFYGFLVLFDWSLGESIGRDNRYFSHVYSFLIQINYYWALVNLLPVLPLDGGQISREICTGINRTKGLRRSLWISICCAGFIVVQVMLEASGKPLPVPFLRLGGDFYVALMFGLLGFASYQQLQQLGGPRGRPPGDSEHRDSDRSPAPWERDPDYWKR